MKNEQKFLIGVLAFVLGFTLVSGKANAVSTEKNNLSNISTGGQSTAQAVFLVSKPKSLLNVKKSVGVLAKYQNATSLTDKQLKELLYAVGFRGQGLVKAWAVAKKESGGQPLKYNGNSKTGDSSMGLFQINMISMLGPDRREKFGLNFSAELMNPVVNAQVAYYMSSGGKDWSAWHGLTSKTRYWMSQYYKI